MVHNIYFWTGSNVKYSILSNMYYETLSALQYVTPECHYVSWGYLIHMYYIYLKVCRHLAPHHIQNYTVMNIN